jgi:hypothetical protein
MLLGTAIEQRHPDDGSPDRSFEAVASGYSCCVEPAADSRYLPPRHHEQAAFTEMKMRLRRPADVAIREYNGSDVSVLDVRECTSTPLLVKVLGQRRVGTDQRAAAARAAPSPVRPARRPTRRGRNPVRRSADSPDAR